MRGGIPSFCSALSGPLAHRSPWLNPRGLRWLKHIALTLRVRHAPFVLIVSVSRLGDNRLCDRKSLPSPLPLLVHIKTPNQVHSFPLGCRLLQLYHLTTFAGFSSGGLGLPVRLQAGRSA